MRTIAKTIYTLDELPEEIQEKVIDNFAQNIEFDCDLIIDDAKEIGSLFGLDIDKVYFRGFWSQGDGACFEGSYSYKRGGLKAVKDYAPRDERLHAIVRDFQEFQRRNFYRLAATTKHRGHYYHEYSMWIDTDGNDDIEDGFKELFADYARWIYRNLRDEYEFQTSEGAIRESIECNGYEFDEHGNLV